MLMKRFFTRGLVRKIFVLIDKLSQLILQIYKKVYVFPLFIQTVESEGGGKDKKRRVNDQCKGEGKGGGTGGGLKVSQAALVKVSIDRMSLKYMHSAVRIPGQIGCRN